MDTPIPPERFQTASRVLMIRPSKFGYHPQAAQSNAFMHQPDQDAQEIAERAQVEFDGLVGGLRNAGVEVLVYQDARGLPDCVFPNNWMSWHSPIDGEPVIVTYPMCDELRRAERSDEVLDLLASTFGTAGHLDLSAFEGDGEILEGTGSLVLDRTNGVAFACLSARTTMNALDAWCDETGYSPIAFEAMDENGEPIYHTNVIMSVGERIAVVCSESIADQENRDRVRLALKSNDRQVMEITRDQMASFCGNILELTNTNGESVFAMSSRAFHAFSVQQQSLLQSLGQIVHVPIPTIEDVGGGSVRCMIAECGRG